MRFYSGLSVEVPIGSTSVATGRQTLPRKRSGRSVLPASTPPGLQESANSKAYAQRSQRFFPVFSAFPAVVEAARCRPSPGWRKAHPAHRSLPRPHTRTLWRFSVFLRWTGQKCCGPAAAAEKAPIRSFEDCPARFSGAAPDFHRERAAPSAPAW